MVRNNNPGGRRRRSSISKAKKASCQNASIEDLTHLDDPADMDINDVSLELQTTDQDQLGYSDRVYLLASVVFQNNHLEKPAAVRLVNYGNGRELPLPEVKDKRKQCAAYELAFSTLKYQALLEDILTDSSVYRTHPTPEDQMSLVAVMLFDLQDREFLPRKRSGKEEIIQEVQDVEKYLLRFKTKLAASLARYRVKHDLLSIESFLPESVRTKQESCSSLPLYAWVNTLKSSLDEVQRVLRLAGFSQVKSIGELQGQTFCCDPHCGDTLVLPAPLRAQLYSTKLLSDRKLIIQDKSCSLGPNAVCSLLPEDGDVLMVGCFSGLTVSHTASLIAEKYKGNGSHQPSVYVCVSDRTDAQREELLRTIAAMGCKNVKLVPEDFQTLDGSVKQLQRVRVILLIPRCSMSAVSNLVEFMLYESGDTDLLHDYSQGSIAQNKLDALVAQQRKDIDHALKFPKVLSVVYSTCSSYAEENEGVVSRALEQAKVHSEQRGESKLTHFRLDPSPFFNPDRDKGPGETEAFTLEPSHQSNGCFLAVFNREEKPVVKEAPQDVLARANAKGLLDRIGSHDPTMRKGQHGHTSKLRKRNQACSSQPQISASIQSKGQEINGSNRATSCGQQGLSSRRQPSLGKGKATSSQNPRNTTSNFFSKQDDNGFPSSSPKSESSTAKKSLAPVINVTLSSPRHPVAPPATPVVPVRVVHPRRAQPEVLKPMVVCLPPANFPDCFPSQHSRTGFSPSCTYNRWRSPPQTVPHYRSSLSKDRADKSWSLF